LIDIVKVRIAMKNKAMLSMLNNEKYNKNSKEE